MKWKLLVQRFFRAFGYELTRRGEPSLYTECVPYGYFTYSPWCEPWFQKIYRSIQKDTGVKPDRCYMLYRFAQHCLHLDGEFAECGVFRGGTAVLVACVPRPCRCRGSSIDSA